MTTQLSGVLPVLATPFAADRSLDLDSLARLVRWQFEAGASGVAVFGFASEAFALGWDERPRILDVVCANIADGHPVIAGVAAAGTADAVAQARQALEHGATHLMVLPPHMVTPTPDQLVEFYGEVAAVGLPIMVQDAPGNSRVTMSVEFIGRLAAIDGVTSVKVEAAPTVPKIAALASAVPDAFALLGGQNAQFCLEEFARGAVGTMPACEFTDLLRAVLVDFEAGDTAAARAGFARLLPLIRFGLQPGLAWAIHKEVLVQRGLIACAAVRAPARPVDDWTRAWLRDLLTDLQIGAGCG